MPSIVSLPLRILASLILVFTVLALRPPAQDAAVSRPEASPAARHRGGVESTPSETAVHRAGEQAVSKSSWA